MKTVSQSASKRGASCAHACRIRAVAVHCACGQRELIYVFINWSRVDLSPEKQLANQNAETGEHARGRTRWNASKTMLVLSGDMVYEYGIGTYCKFLQIGKNFCVNTHKDIHDQFSGVLLTEWMEWQFNRAPK